MKHKLLNLILFFTITFSLILGNANITQAIPWQELILRGIQVIQISNISDEQEVEFGAQIRQQLIAQRKVKLYQNRDLSNYINQIGQRLVSVSSRSDLPYTFQVVNNPEINAFATMGGFIYLNTGLIKKASNEAELASVMAHEIGHVVARHSQKQMRQQAVTQGLLSAAGLDKTKAVQLGVALALDLPYSRKDEYEADDLGLQILYDAGYAPGAMVNFMTKLGQLGGKTPTLLSTHPNGGDRAVALAQKIPRNIAFKGDGLNEQEYRYNIRALR
ncbi:MAG: M48 family metalloprotease [Cyanobacteria bacterium]|nr:M48 family metalloprotease [Cyanobacteria bacterium CG_2015-16_32_12]NCO78260.1 M48 family metalloprotease [Cyanobacteria bacterium CG_2015-22_32_23]NCQ02897.1 M48 family metalloprotease [Cyanobacteria bacterium CG_2015-09_32_10]NCQ42764.1 M48 family metalloprotease [Cyanobacteria bacterium CG_2015-04_32_10]NCS83486.1 M48 family metalloprotease [Cyanobacteria bacterium CG_2015-02_32_10]